MKLLAWIMARFNVSPELIGDVAEDYSGTGSRLRLLRQTFSAVRSTIGVGLWHHKWLTLRSAAIGWILFWITLASVSRIGIAYQGNALQLLLFSGCGLVGWVVARSHRAQPLGAAMFFGISVTAVSMYSFYDQAPNSYPLWSFLLSTVAILGAIMGGALLHSSTGSPSLD